MDVIASLSNELKLIPRVTLGGNKITHLVVAFFDCGTSPTMHIRLLDLGAWSLDSIVMTS